MTQPPGSGPSVPRTAVEWDRVRESKIDALSRDPLSIRPDDYPDVRPEVVLSWRRSLLAGADPQATGFPVDEHFQPGTRLARVAQPIMSRLEDEISDLDSWGFLTDRQCRLMTAVVGDYPGAGRVHRMNLHPGTCFAEDVIGTNGLGCAHELQQAFLVSGTEHFRADSEVLTTTGVIIRDPFTKRYAGTFGVHCRREYGAAAHRSRSWLRSAGRSRRSCWPAAPTPSATSSTPSPARSAASAAPSWRSASDCAW